MSIKNSNVFEKAFETVVYGDVSTSLEPILFTSCCRQLAEKFNKKNPQTALIHSTKAGKTLEDLKLFDHMGPERAYLYWYILSARFIAENSFPNQVSFFGDLANQTSTLFGLEIPLIHSLKPNVTSFFNHISGKTYPSETWKSEDLIRTYWLDLINSYLMGPSYTPQDTRLITKLGDKKPEQEIEGRMVLALKCVLAGYVANLSKVEINGLKLAA